MASLSNGKFSDLKRANFAAILRRYLCANSHKKHEMIHFGKYRIAAGGNLGRNSAQYNTEAVLRVGLEGCCKFEQPYLDNFLYL